jgi:hypothetical protein
VARFLGPLPADRKIAPVAVAAVRADFNQSLDVHGDFLAQVAFHRAFFFNNLADPGNLVFVQVLDLLAGVNARAHQNGHRARPADAINVGQPNFRPFGAGQINSCDACHCSPHC